MRIFISYASEQRATASDIASALKARGFEVFFDRSELTPGQGYDANIEDAIKAADFMVFLVSPEAVQTGRYTLTELEFAAKKWSNPSDRVLPVLVRPTTLESIPKYLRPMTLLEPKGNIAAEVGAHVAEVSARRQGKRWLAQRNLAVRTLVSAAGVFSVATAGFAMLFAHPYAPCNIGAQGWRCELSSVKPQLFHGYYLTLDDKGAEQCAHEEINLAFGSSGHNVTGDAQGLVHDRDGTQRIRRWTYKGYWLGRSIALAYMSHDEPPRGAGTYHLVSQGGDYQGYWMGIDFPTEKHVRCPYLLTKEKTELSCRERWPDVFSQSCEILDRSR